MLDVHAVVGTPGAIGTLTKLATLIPTDGLVVPGIPLRPDARLILHGSISKIANTIAQHQLISQDMLDPINGENAYLGSASLKNLFYKFCNILFGTGARSIYQTSNTAQTANSFGVTLDHYEPGSKVGDCQGPGLRFIADTVAVPQTLNADVAISWVVTPYAPATPIPNGKYALLGFLASKMTEAHVIRFAHADFGWCLPGIPTVDHMIATGPEQGMNDHLAMPGYQFEVISELTKKPCIPVFTVSNAATGLNIHSLAATATDTPVITPYLAKVG
jgi:hypothetical protein